MLVFYFVPQHWTVPFFASIWGFLTNWIAIWMVFNPIEPHYFRFIKLFHKQSAFPFIKPVMPHIATYNWQGGFMKRQDEVSEVFADVVVKELVTVETIMDEMMYGHRSAQTRQVVRQHLHQLMDSPVIATTLRMGLGTKEFGHLENTIIDKSIRATMVPIRDPDLNVSRAEKIFGMFRDRIRQLSPQEFQNLLRPAFKEDELTLIILGGLTGFLAGWLHLIVVFY